MDTPFLDPKRLKKGVDYQTLAGLLRLCSFTHVDEHIGYFWSTELLSRIMTRDRVIDALANECRPAASPPVGLQSLADVILAVHTAFTTSPPVRLQSLADVILAVHTAFTTSKRTKRH